jgi:cell division protein FtsB
MSVTSANPNHASTETFSGFVLSLLFWLSLLAATVMFAAVGLCPKLMDQARLRDQYATNQFRLIQIERQNEQLNRVVQAIRHDKEFAAEMTRMEFDAVNRDEEVIPVAPNLRLSPPTIEVPQSSTAVPRAWHLPLMMPFAENETLRRSLLISAGVLVAIAFTWFQPASPRQSPKQASPRFSMWRALQARYTRHEA